MYLLNQLVAALSRPLVFALVLALIGLIAWRLRHRRTAATLFVAAGFVTYLASTSLMAGALLRPLA